MTIAHLLIVCFTALVAVAIAARSYVAVKKDASASQVVGSEREARAARQVADAIGALSERDARAARQVADAVAELAAAAATLEATAAALERSAGQAGPSRVGQRVTVHTKQPDDQTIYGVVVGDYIDRLSLEDADLVTPMGPQSLPGRRHEIAIDDISWIDLHGHVTVPDSAPSAEA